MRELAVKWKEMKRAPGGASKRGGEERGLVAGAGTGPVNRVDAPAALTPAQAAKVGGRGVVKLWSGGHAAAAVLFRVRVGLPTRVEEVAVDSAPFAPAPFLEFEVGREGEGFIRVVLPRFDAGEDTESYVRSLLRDVLDYIDDPAVLVKLFITTCRELYSYEYGGYYISLTADVHEDSATTRGRIQLKK